MQFERYSVTNEDKDLIVHMRQRGNGIGLAIISILVLFTNLLFSPIGVNPVLPSLFFWIATIFIIIIFLLAIIAVFYSERFHFTPNRVEYRNSFGKTLVLEYEKNLLLRIRAASPQARRSGTRVYPYEIILLSKEDTESRILFLFQSKSTAQAFIHAISDHIPVKIVDIIQDDFFNERKLDKA